MENNQLVYVNTLAEGALIGEQQITSENIRMVARSWQRSQTVAHYKLFGIEEIRKDGIKRTFMVGDIGAAKIMLPADEAFSGLEPGHKPSELLDFWISAVVEDFDFKDEANPVIMLNRRKALDRLRDLNARRVNPGEQAYGVIQGMNRGGYILNVGGHTAIMPKAFYSWNFDSVGRVGEGFNVKIMPHRGKGLLVSRRELNHNPFEDALMRIKVGMTVKVKVTHIYRGLLKGDINPGVKISINSANMRRIISVGDDVLVKVRGSNKREFYGLVSY